MSRLHFFFFIYLACLLLGGFVPVLRGQVYERVFDFADARNADVKSPGQNPYSQLILAWDDNFYGTTYEGGRAGYGTIFRVTANGEHTVLFEFDGSNGRDLLGDLTQGSDGSFYGMTSAGGSGHGTIYKVTAGGAFTSLVQFTGNGASNKGSSPRAGLVQHPDGFFYGTTFSGGTANLGTVFKMSPEGQLTTLVEFTGNTGSFPGAYAYSSLMVGSDGNLYGTTGSGGNMDKGTIFKLTPSGIFTTLVEFTGDGATNRGAGPLVGLVEGPDGYFYGTTEVGGVENDGTIFKMSPSGVLTTLVEFDRNLDRAKGSFPDAGLIFGADGNLYGTTQYGGAQDYGLVFKMTPSGTMTTLVEFTYRSGPNLGAEPHAELTLGTDGSLYGTTAGGGTRGLGTAFKLSPSGQFTTLVDFDDYTVADRGANPRSGLLRGSDGTLYGTTALDGANSRGTIFKITPAGRLETLVHFTGTGGAARGANPMAELIWGQDGFLYGTTRNGGSLGYGTVFKVSITGELTTLLDFTLAGATNRGGNSESPLTLGSDGHFYGTTTGGGSSGNGTVFKMTSAGILTTLREVPSGSSLRPSSGLTEGPDGSFYGFSGGGVYKITSAGLFTQLLSFTGTTGANKGAGPVAELLLASDGLFYGVTSGGGASNAGTVFRMTTAGVLTTLVEFTGNGLTNKGGGPSGTLCEGPNGTFWGTTVRGGAADYGTVFRMSSSGELTTIREFPSSIDHGIPAGGLTFGADGNVYGTTGGVVFEGSFPRYRDGSVYRLVLPGAPNVTMVSCSAVSIHEALLEAQVNARGAITSVVLEYGFDGVIFPSTVPVAAGVSGYQTKLVGATVSGLNAATTYFCRLKAQSAAGTTYSPVWSLSTLGAPVAISSSATDLAPASARFNGTVNARNYDATVRLEWSTDGNSFPNSVAATPAIVTGNADVAVSAPVAGLTKGTTYYYRVVATNAGGTTVSGTQSFRTLTEPTAGIGGNFALTTTSVRVEGSVNAQGANSSVVFEYGTDGVSFPNSVAATPSAVTGEINTPVSAVLTTLAQGATYHYRIKATSAGGVGMSASASFSMNVLSGFTQVFPNAPPESEGFLTVNLMPVGLLHGWRFVGEQQWRPSGVPVAGLTSSNREIEFRPVPGYVQPEPEPVGIVSGEASVYTFEYTSGGSTGSGGILVTLKPSTLTSAQWRLLGETEADWRNSDVVLSSKAPGNYLIECKPVAGRATPPNVNVSVINGQTSAATITYFIPDATVGTPPVVISFESITTDATRPYAHVGQFRSQLGSSTGFVVKPRVVATAAHVVWDDGSYSGSGSLSTVQGLQWLFQRYRGVHEPTPVIPRGFYTFDGYAAQRIADNSPGDSSPASQHRDVAAVYFNTNAGRGGYAGFLASDLTQNEFLLSNANKMLVGYPIDGINPTSQGRMHATAPFNVVFSTAFGRTFTTSGIRSSGGNSGGPLCVQFEGGAYYPAAIYLGGDNQTVVRAIDSEVVDLFNRAEISSGGGDNNTGGGITHTSISGTTSSTTGSVQVIIEPEAARNAGAGWRLGTSGSYRVNGAVRSSVTPGSYTLNMITVSGFDTPTSPTITVSGGQLTAVTYTYAAPMNPLETWRQTHFGTPSNIGNAANTFDFDSDGFTNAQEYAAGTNPTLSGDFFKVTDSQRTASTFTASTTGKAGRTYTLQRSTNLTSWSVVGSPQGPLASDGAVTLQDEAMPNDAAFYRIVVTGP